MRLPAPAPIPALVAGLLAAAPGLASAQGHETAFAATRDPVSQGIVAVIIVLVFAVLARETAHRVLVIFGSVSLLWLITYLTPYVNIIDNLCNHLVIKRHHYINC
jgi:hypothetical protein